MRVAILSLGVLLVVGCGQAPSAPSEPLVKADPKTLVLQAGDYPPAWVPDAASSGPASGALASNGPKPLDSYAEVINAAGSTRTSLVVLYKSSADAKAAFSARYPAGATLLSFKGDFAVGDQQRVYGVNDGQIHAVHLEWLSGNVIAELAFLHSTTTYYPTASSMAALMDGVYLQEFEELSPRVQTHIRLARTT
jgi:hypothetical protein